MNIVSSVLKKLNYRVAVYAGIIISLPTLVFGLFLDDYIQLLTIDGEMTLGSAYDTYVFGPNNPDKTIASRDEGVHPWFVLPELKLHFFRPLSSALMVLDRTIFGNWTALYHLHSLFWWMLLLCIVAVFYRQIFGITTLGCLAMLFFSLDEAHVLPVAWWANRNSLVASTFAVAFLSAHLAWRENQWRSGAIISPIALVFAYLSGEVAVGIMGYLFAYEMLGNRQPILRRICALVLPGIITSLYLIFYITKGYGVYGSGVYVDPIHQPIEFFSWAPGRMLILMGTQFFMIPAEAAIAFPFTFAPLSILGCAASLFVFWLIKKSWPTLSERQKESIRWIIPGMLLSIAPVLATFPSMRLLMMPSLGAAVVLAVIFEFAWRKFRETSLKTWKCLSLGIIIMHCIIAPSIWWITILTSTGINNSALHEYREMRLEQYQGKAVILLQSSNPVLCFYTKVFQKYFKDSAISSWHCLSWAAYDMKLTRTSENTFVMELINGQMLSKDYESIFRSPAFPIRDGESVKLPIFSATILESGDIGPKKIRYTFNENLDSQNKFVFLHNKNDRIVEFMFPKIGQSVLLVKDNWI